ncbi:hypothetical protein GCM10027568_28050 [Humibacter soli]
MNIVVALIGAAGCLVLIAALLVMHFMPTGLSPILDPVSAYALSNARAWYAVAGIAAAVSGGASAILLADVPATRASVVLLWIFAAARLVIPLFPMDRPGTDRTQKGRLHNLLAIVAFATVTVAAFLAAGPLANSGRTGIAVGSTCAAIVMAIGSILVIASSVAPPLRRIFGLAERLIYLGFIAWFLTLALGTIID